MVFVQTPYLHYCEFGVVVVVVVVEEVVVVVVVVVVEVIVVYRVFSPTKEPLAIL